MKWVILSLIPKLKTEGNSTDRRKNVLREKVGEFGRNEV